MEKHEGDTASQEVLEQQVTAIIGLSVWSVSDCVEKCSSNLHN